MHFVGFIYKAMKWAKLKPDVITTFNFIEQYEDSTYVNENGLSQ